MFAGYADGLTIPEAFVAPDDGKVPGLQLAFHGDQIVVPKAQSEGGSYRPAIGGEINDGPPSAVDDRILVYHQHWAAVVEVESEARGHSAADSVLGVQDLDDDREGVRFGTSVGGHCHHIAIPFCSRSESVQHDIYPTSQANTVHIFLRYLGMNTDGICGNDLGDAVAPIYPFSEFDQNPGPRGR